MNKGGRYSKLRVSTPDASLKNLLNSYRFHCLFSSLSLLSLSFCDNGRITREIRSKYKEWKI